MVAPNGARRTTADHPELPVTIPQIVDTAKACYAAGAGGIHAHVRDADQRHVLDAGLYSELTGELARQVPGMAVQITTEAVGRYTPDEQRAVVRAVMPEMVSVSLREMLPDDDDTADAARFYAWAHEAEIAVQHILYAPDEIARLAALVSVGVVPREDMQLLFVLGRYAVNQESDPADLQPFLSELARSGLEADWAVCAFGRGETAALAAAFEAGGKVRVGFENSLWNADGSVAADNAERVSAIAAVAEH
ncbi:3-keto-5-aminohexanoate cleavage protein [Oricola thermophila]|uniref:3-keto-5-aminohexanoate cleavage protein n=2 Tax=Oricola thermophila TaxID=2742145 RepID=A0A6N1VIM5_9HYPH|nr:3-keto-5-aminohexanoate cleavage protein [Oricola thermophila]